jgi:hypothetical protein
MASRTTNKRLNIIKSKLMKKFKYISLSHYFAGFSAVGQKMTIENQDYSNNSGEIARCNEV